MGHLSTGSLDASFFCYLFDKFRDVLITGIVNCATSFYAGFAVFSVLGYMSQQMNQPLDDIVASGPGLAFVTYPQSLSTMPLASFWAILFFFMLILLGIGSELVHFENVMTCVLDELPSFRHPKKRIFVNIGCVAVCCLIGLVFTTKGGFYAFYLVDWYSCSFGLFIIALFEAIVFGWIYGLDRIDQNFKEMFGYGVNWYLKVTWKFIAPLTICFISVFSIIRWNPISFGSYTYPVSARAAGWMIAMSSIAPIPLLALWKIATSSGSTCLKKIQYAAKPTKSFEADVHARVNSALEKDISEEELQIL